MSSTATGLGAELARAIAAKDHARLAELLDPAVDFRGLTPNRAWEARGPDEVEPILRTWFDEDDAIEELERIETDSFADRERVGYRLRVRNPDGEFTVEQQAYLGVEGGRIVWLRVLCSGFRPVDDA